MGKDMGNGQLDYGQWANGHRPLKRELNMVEMFNSIL